MTASAPIRSAAHRMLLRFEGALNAGFGNDLNPFYHLGALGFFFFWVVVVSGSYIYIFYKTGTQVSYQSVESLTHGQWYLGGIMRSLHRYASDALVLVMMLHLLREFILGRYRGVRWYAWVTGVPILWVVFSSGINGYWMVWDKLAQYIAIGTTEWFDWLPLFSEPMARYFLTEQSVSDRFFSLISFAHVTLPLILLFFLWAHILRISLPDVNPRRGLAVGMLLALLALSLIRPAVSQGPANLGQVPANVNLDWFYLYIYPLLDVWSAGWVWALVTGITLILTLLPWLPSRYKQIPVAEVSLKDCSGCGRCVADCPYEAVVMMPRSDGRSFLEEAVVKPDRCVSCGICAGACPSSTPFRSDENFISGIELPSLLLHDLRTAMLKELENLKGDARVMVFGCDNAADVESLRGAGVAVQSLPCAGMLPPSFIEYAMRERRVEGVFLTGCREDDCYHRLGGEWTEQRLAAEREPRLRSRAERARIKYFRASSVDSRELAAELDAFRDKLRQLAR